MSLAHRRILLGVSGGIAAYKACELVRRLHEVGAEVRVVMTESATHFVSATTFQALSGQAVRTSLWDAQAEAAMGHIELARWAERIVIAPASADVLARLAHGLADDLLTTLCLASAAPLYAAPAMNQQMWAHPAVQANVAVLRQRGVHLLGPGAGDQACGDVGAGRMLEPHALRDALAASFADGALRGLRVLVSAGPTYEDIDPVRFVGNRSSGRMGVRSAAQMHAAVLAAAADADIYVGAAAVADYRPAQPLTHKMKKHDGAALTLALEETPDILGTLSTQPVHPFLVGFAAETETVTEYAQDKLQRKGLDMIAANQVGDGVGFEVAENALNVLWSGGSAALPRAPKEHLARALVAHIALRYRAVRG